jgi:hypothetical protein
MLLACAQKQVSFLLFSAFLLEETTLRACHLNFGQVITVQLYSESERKFAKTFLILLIP